MRAIVEHVRIKRRNWLGHVLRRLSNTNPKIALIWAPEGKRKRGRPKETR